MTSPPAGTHPAAEPFAARARVQIDAAIRSLSPPLREVIVLRELEDLEYAQIALIVALAVSPAGARRSTALMRATSSRGSKGLPT